MKRVRHYPSSVQNVYYIDASILGYLYTEFLSQTDYEYVLKYAKELDIVLWENAAKRCFFCTMEGHTIVKEFINRSKEGNV